jgi:hypothetical protein
MSKAKDKGKRLESYVAKVFQESFGLTKYDVHRNQTSGNFHTEFGDVWFRTFPIVIECKNQESWKYKHLLTFSKPIQYWWNQLLKDVERYRLELKIEPLYMLVVSKNREPKYAIMDINNLQNNAFKQIDIDQILNSLKFISVINMDKIITFFEDIISLLSQEN